MTREPPSDESDPYDAVFPNSTCEVAAWSVVQVMVADVDVIPVAVSDVITGAGVAAVEKMKFADEAVPAESPESTA